MDKEEAMKILKDFHDKSALFSVRTALDTIIPELRKSEDERIREEIKVILANTDFSQFALDYTFADMITWLEKQCDHANFRNKIQIGDKVTRNEAGILVNMSQLNRIAKPRRAKPVDKVEPKFKVGDWIVNDYCFGKVIEITNDAYLLETGQGIPFSCEHNVHLWTIKDANDGDVLACDINKAEIGGDVEKLPNITPTICIYQSVVKDKDYIHSYSSLYDGSSLVLQNTMYYNYFVHNIHPATKEQRDLLFQKMKEAGYEWSGDTHELKKLSQRMISAEAKEALYDKPTDEEMKELLRTEYEKGRADTLSEMKSSWSEEDEKMLEGIVNTVKDARCQSLLSEIEIYDDYIDWLKSLKDRYTWRPSNEQIDTLEHFVRSIGESGYASPYDNNTKLLYSLLEQLKKLKA